MPLAEVQVALARLFTDAAARDQLRKDPGAAATAWNLSSEELQLLERIEPRQVEFFARSLRVKRFNEVIRLLPRTHQALGKEYAELFHCFALTGVPSGLHKHRQDAIDFARYLEQVALPARTDRQWLVDLVRYERGWLTAWSPDRQFVAMRFPRDIRQPQPTHPESDTRSYLAVWYRLRPRGPLRHRLCRLPWS